MFPTTLGALMNTKATPRKTNRFHRGLIQAMIGGYLRNNIDSVVTEVSGNTPDDEERATIRQAILAEANRLDPEGVEIDT